jgi:hypothetical protein
VREGDDVVAPAEERARTRDILFHWRGQVLWKLPQYSMGIRHQLVTLFRGMEREGVVVSHEHSPGFLAEMRRSTFCGVCPGNGWGHLETPVLLGCIPVVFMDDILTPWEGVLDFSSFGVRVPRRRLPQLIQILRRIPPARIAQLRQGLARVWERFTYSSLALAERQRRCGTPGWRDAGELGCVPANARDAKIGFLASPEIRGHDAIDTLMRVLHARLVSNGSVPRLVEAVAPP